MVHSFRTAERGADRILSSSKEKSRMRQDREQTRRKSDFSSPLTCVLGLLVWVVLVESAASFSVQQPPRTSSSQEHSSRWSLHAVGIPIDAGFSWPVSRKSRIQCVLEKAKSRTGVENIRQQRPSSSSVSHTDRVGSDSAQLLPFSLPTLSDAQTLALESYEIVIEQSEMGRMGSGFVVQDVMASEEMVWDCLLDFEGYEKNIPTVRSARVRGTTPRKYGISSTTGASFEVSRFRLTISAIFHYHPERNYMELSLDNDIQNSALQSAKGYWYTERLHNNTVTRVWLLCDLTVSPLLPNFVVDCAAQSSMPRASSWLRPTVAAHALAVQRSMTQQQEHARDSPVMR